MTQKLANEVKNLASPCYKTIQAIAGEKCAACGGKGKVPIWTPNEDDSSSEESCNKCSGTGKVGWKWEPEPGEWCIFGFAPPALIGRVFKETGNLLLWAQPIQMHKSRVIPILPWETIERILEGVGYSLEFTDKGIIENCGAFICDRKNRTKTIFSAEAKTRTRAVYEAVIALRKEI